VARRLARVSLDGIEILDVARVLDNDRALGRVITESETIAQLPVGTDVGAALARFAGDEPLKLLRESEKAIARTVDVRKTLRSLSPFEDGEARLRLGWTDGPMISFSVSVSNEGSAKPSEVVTTLFGLDIAQKTDLARRALWGDERTDPLRVSELRRRPVVARPAAAAAAP
jgi:hypothetical protein